MAANGARRARRNISRSLRTRGRLGSGWRGLGPRRDVTRRAGRLCRRLRVWSGRRGLHRRRLWRELDNPCLARCWGRRPRRGFRRLRRGLRNSPVFRLLLSRRRFGHLGRLVDLHQSRGAMLSGRRLLRVIKFTYPIRGPLVHRTRRRTDHCAEATRVRDDLAGLQSQFFR
jgi:hypothetical protein